MKLHCRLQALGTFRIVCRGVYFCGIFAATLGLFWTSSAQAGKAVDCTKYQKGEPVLLQSDMRGTYHREALDALFDRLYKSDKRLPDRVYFDEEKKRHVLPLKSWGGDVILSEKFIDAVVWHIEYALERGLAEHVFLPDMGHTHLQIPDELWQKRYTHYDFPAQAAQFYTDLFNDPRLELLYHTAEKYDYNLRRDANRNIIIDDPYLRTRYETRNLFGENRRGGRVYTRSLTDRTQFNTVRSIDGYQYFGAGFYIHANKNGCFSYRKNGRVYRFDINQSGAAYEGFGAYSSR